MRGRRFFQWFAFVLLCSAQSGSLSAQDRSAPKSHSDGNQQTETQSEAAKRQNFLRHRAEQLRKSGDQAAAIALAHRSLMTAEQRHGRDHPAVATALITIGGLYAREHRYAEAEQAYKRALEIREKTLGANHPDTVAARDKLASLYEAEGKRDLAVRYRSRAQTTERSDFAKQLKGTSKPRNLKVEAAPPPAALPKASEGAKHYEYYEPSHQDHATPTTSPQPVPGYDKSDWDIVPVFYGTDRDHEPNLKRLSYNADRAHRLELGRALVTVPKIHQVPQIERPWAIHIPYFNVTVYEEAEDPKKHFTLQEIKALSKAEFLQFVRARLASSNAFKDHALVFVHGYDTAFDNALYRTAQIAYDLHFDGAPFVYSWPSGGAVTSYTYDRESAEGSEPYLRQFLDLVVKETGAKTVSVIAHSMGNKPLLDVLRDMKAAAPKDVVISQVILAAPDVDADNFTNLAQQISGLAKGVTLYAAGNDRALLASRHFWGHYRAGDVPENGGPLVVSGIDSIDVSAASTDVFALNHSDYAQNNDLLKDIAKLITTGQRPPDRRFERLKPVSTGQRLYWRYMPGPPTDTGTP